MKISLLSLTLLLYYTNHQGHGLRNLILVIFSSLGIIKYMENFFFNTLNFINEIIKIVPSS